MICRLLLTACDTGREELLSRMFETGNQFQLVNGAKPGALVPSDLLQFDGLVLVGAEWGLEPLEVLRTIRAALAIRELPIILVTDNTVLARDAWAAGADAVFAFGASSQEVRARTEILVGTWQRRQAEATLLKEAEMNLRGLSSLALDLANSASPGLKLRGEEVAWVAGQIAERFQVPTEFHEDLFMAARLHAIGRCLLEAAGDTGSEPWRWAAVTAAELRLIPGLNTAADLVTSSAENWDGSGHPAGLQRGQIPLRSRIVRFAVDLVDASVRISNDYDTRGLVTAVAALSAYSGTLYDPAVVTEAESIFLAEEPKVKDVRRVAVEALEPGMRLAEDLVTASGVKLLAAGGVLTSASLGLITRRHMNDPIVHAVRVWIPSS